MDNFKLDGWYVTTDSDWARAKSSLTNSELIERLKNSKKFLELSAQSTERITFVVQGNKRGARYVTFKWHSATGWSGVVLNRVEFAQEEDLE